MMKKTRSKEMTGAEPGAVNKGTIYTKLLRCTRDSDMPGIGLFRCGEIVSDQRKVAMIADNPNFEIVKEETL